MPNEKANETRAIAGLEFLPRQWQSVTAPIGPVLVLAGPGSGKTRCLAGRIAYLIHHKGADPYRICAITFTNRAAQEIASRAREGLGSIAENLTLGTIHSLCLNILRPFAMQMNLPPGFGIADEHQQQLALRRLGVHKTLQRKTLTSFERRRLEGYELDAREEQLFQWYEETLRSNRLIDYDDILVLTRQLLTQHPATRQDVQNRWDHVLVDEFQDLDGVQYEILKILADRHRSIFAVGDDEQSIFSWRGADSRIMARFMSDFAIKTSVMLDANFRCSKSIFETARRILRQSELYPRREITAIRNSSFVVEASEHANEHAEAAWLVAHLKEELATSGLPHGEFAILYRRHEIGTHLEQALIAAGVACQMGKGRSLADDPVMAQILCSLRLILNPNSDLDLERLACLVLSEAIVAELVMQPGESLREKLRQYATSKAGDEARKCWRLLYRIENLESLSRTAGNLANLIDTVVSLGIGPYVSPFDNIAEQLEDPAANPAASELASKILEVASQSGKLILAPHEGIEVPIRLMLRKVLPNLRVVYFSPETIRQPGDLVIEMSMPDYESTDPEIYNLWMAGLSPTMVMFTALQIIESRHFQKVFTEYVVFDTETTDKDTERCEIVELAAARIRCGLIVDRFVTLVRCNRPISTGATGVHGYVDEDLIGKRSLEEIWPSFREFIGDSVLVAHNAQRFDIPILKRLSAPWDGLKCVRFFDSLPFAKHLFPTGSLSLEDLAIRYGIHTGRSHHALDDSICLAHVFERLQEERLRRSRKTCLTHLLDLLAISLAIENQDPLSDVTEKLFRKGARLALGRYSSALVDYESEAASSDLVCPPLAEIVDRLGGEELQTQLTQERAPQDRFPELYARIERLLVSARVGSLEESIQCFLDQLALSRSDIDGLDRDRVSLLTMHATKGLEFSRVYIVGVEDSQQPGDYPLKYSLESEISEARRLLYVAMTRAKERLCLTYCRERKGKPSGGTMFLSEMGLVQSQNHVSSSGVPQEVENSTS
jgi:DNA helicase II / ATP-dependent DNA helicase PcrA